MRVYQYCINKDNPLFDKVISLLKLPDDFDTDSYEETGKEIPIESYGLREVYADFFSISQNENYKAGQAGFKPEVGVLISMDDFDGEELVQIDEDVFHIYRVYGRGEMLELYCEVR